MQLRGDVSFLFLSYLDFMLKSCYNYGIKKIKGATREKRKENGEYSADKEISSLL